MCLIYLVATMELLNIALCGARNWSHVNTSEAWEGFFSPLPGSIGWGMEFV